MHESSTGPAHRPCRRHGSTEAGFALLFAVVALLIIGTIGAAALQVSLVEMQLSGNHRQTVRAYHGADGVAETAVSELLELGRSLGRFPDAAELEFIEPPPLEHLAVEDVAVSPSGPAFQAPLRTGYYQGMRATSRAYSVDVTVATRESPLSRATVGLDLLVDLIPIFQFAVFYDGDLELMPGPPVALDGRIHGNADVYIGSGSTLTTSTLMAAGDIHNRRKDGALTPSGAVRIRDARGAFPAMGGLDSGSPAWREDALRRWDGNVRTGEHGVTRLPLAIPDVEDPRRLIEPGYDDDTPEDRAAKLFYESSVSINILNGQGFDRSGNPIALMDSLEFVIILDRREDRPMLTVELDLEQLAGLPDYPAGPAVVYVGSFKPGRGIPDWDVELPPIEETLEHLQDIVDANSGTTLADVIEAVIDELDAAVSACQGLLPALLRIVGIVVDGVLGDLTGLVNDGLLSVAEFELLEPQVERVRRCELGGGRTDWPPEWEGYDPPYAGGDTEFAVKITNAEELPDGLTLVSANPAYVQGDFNRVDKKPAAVVADAVTILSNAWGSDDLGRSQGPLSDRIAADTTVNASFMVGNTETTRRHYNGGVENLLRLLEDWSGKRLRFEGSLVALWNSEHATGRWRHGDPVYREPWRDWQFDTDFLDPALLPPATPEVTAVRLASWDWR